MKNVLVIAPHPDDETLGCGGTILKHIDQGDKVFWLIVTHATQELNFPQDWIEKRKSEISAVHKAYGFEKTFELGFPTTLLDNLPGRDLISSMSEVINQVQPQVLYVPFRGDVHSDHTVVYDAAIAATKWFRAPFVKEIYAYETPSETDMALPFSRESFLANRFVNITDYFDQKLAIMHIFESECGTFPFPRSDEMIEALARYRGGMVGHHKAEAFMALRQIID